MLFQAIYSRVARVCKWDKGGPHRFRNRWTSFLKSRLNCSIPGDYPFYFNEIRKWLHSPLSAFPLDNLEFALPHTESASNLVEGQYGSMSSKLIYGVFNTPTNSIPGSAVCAFALQVSAQLRLPLSLLSLSLSHSLCFILFSSLKFFAFLLSPQDIADTFEGQFKEQSGINSNWLPVNNAKVRTHYNSVCVCVCDWASVCVCASGPTLARSCATIYGHTNLISLREAAELFVCQIKKGKEKNSKRKRKFTFELRMLCQMTPLTAHAAKRFQKEKAC